MDIASIESKLSQCDGEINQLITDIDNIMASLKESSTSSPKSVNIRSTGSVLNSNKFIKIHYSGSTYNVIITPNISVLDLVRHVQRYGITQRANLDYNNYGNKCLGVAKAYGRALMTGNLSRNIDNFYSGAYTYFDGGTASVNKQDILRIVYRELSLGKPCVLLISTKAGNRHFGTVVGMKETVTSANDLREEDLLIIDAFDGRLEAMDNSETADRHMHTDGGKYRVDVLKI